MDHRALIASIPVEKRRTLLAQSDAPGLGRLAVHLGLVILGGVWVLAGWPLWPLVMVLQGVLLVFLFTTLHETIHGTAFRTGGINTAVAHLCGFLAVLPANHFRYFHFAHHRFTHDPERDPELEGTKPDTLRGHLIYLTGWSEWRWRLKSIAKQARGVCTDAYIPARGHDRVTRDAQIYILGYAGLVIGSVLVGSSALLWIWVLPSLLGQPFMRAYLLAEHTRCPHVANMLENTRTTFTNRFVRYFAWNMPYHAEHHAYPAIPFHKLPEFHRVTEAHLAQTAEGYTSFNRDHMMSLGNKGPQDEAIV